MRHVTIGIALAGLLLVISPLAAIDPVQQAEAIVRQAQKLEASGQADSAKSLLSTTAREYQTATQKNPKDAGLWSALAQIQLRQRQPEEAAKSINEAIRLQPTNGAFYAIRGCVLACSDQVQAAEADFRRAFELEPKNIQIRIDSAAAYAYVQRFVEAEAQARAAVEIDDRNPGAIALLGLFQLRNGKHPEALGTLRGGVKILPRDLILRKALIEALNSLELFNEAYVHHRELYELDRDNGDVLEGLIILGSQLKRTHDLEGQITQLYVLYREGKYTDYSFAREKFTVGDKTIAAAEYFETNDESPAKFMFHILDDRGHETSKFLLLTTRELHKFFRQPTGDESKPISALVHIIAGKHKTYAAFPGQPGYEQTKQLVVEVLEGKRKPFEENPPAKTE